jgi:hypothetical protein
MNARRSARRAGKTMSLVIGPSPFDLDRRGAGPVVSGDAGRPAERPSEQKSEKQKPGSLVDPGEPRCGDE